MGRRPSGALPVMRRHKPTNTARICVGGKIHSLGRWGSAAAQDRYATLVAAFIASGRKSIQAGLAVVGRPAAAAPASSADKPSPALPDATGGPTVGELARAALLVEARFVSFGPTTSSPPWSVHDVEAAVRAAVDRRRGSRAH